MLHGTTMKTFVSRSLSVAAVSSLLVSLAHAHPGHDGHEGGDITWDFGHLTSHPLATLGCVALLGAASWAVWSHLRSRRSERMSRVRR